MATLSVRLPEGIYEAVGELAENIDMSKSDVATLLIFVGLTSVKGHLFSRKTSELMQADTLESYGSLLRTAAKLTPEARAALEKKLGEFLTKLTKTFPGMV